MDGFAVIGTMSADFPEQAAQKWDWVWKALLFALFLPLTLRTKLRMEATILSMVLCVSALIVTGGIKTAAGGGGYGRPRVMRAIALACAAEHAPRLVYAKGIDPGKIVPTPIGVTCSLCHRADCTARALPPIGRDILPDDYRLDAVPFAFAES